MMQNKMKELDLKERSSKSLLANVLDMDDDFRPSSTLPPPHSHLGPPGTLPPHGHGPPGPGPNSTVIGNSNTPFGPRYYDINCSIRKVARQENIKDAVQLQLASPAAGYNDATGYA